jgi:hypothetical protein
LFDRKLSRASSSFCTSVGVPFSLGDESTDDLGLPPEGLPADSGERLPPPFDEAEAA